MSEQKVAEAIPRQEAELIVKGAYEGILRRPARKEEMQHFVDVLVNGCEVSRLLNIFINCEEFSQRTSTKLFVPPGHFYSPIVPRDEAERHLVSLKMSNSVPGIEIDHAKMASLWEEMLPFIREFPFPEDVTPPFRYARKNPNYGLGDASILFALLRIKKPKQIIEIGSGWSSACALDTIERYLNNQCSVIFVEPYPKLLKELIGKSGHKILDLPVQVAPLEIFEALDAGDILFIDSTHVLRTGSDVCFELFEILPRLKAGVIVHIHDMFWPFEYPKAWILDENRSWNELYAVRAFLMGNKDWEILYFNDYFAKTERERMLRDAPGLVPNPGGGLWLQKTR